MTPRIVPLSRAVVSSSWAGDGDGKTRTAAAAGEDDVIPRAYRNGDELRRVHWRSTARYGELMVRREEQRWRNRALLFLDTRRSSHFGTGMASSFEFAVSAAASVGVHVAREGLDGQLITDSGALDSGGSFEEILLDSLAVIKPSNNYDISRGMAAIRSAEGGLIVAVCGTMSDDAAAQLAACRRDQTQGIALLLAVSSWADQPSPGASGNGSLAGARRPSPGRSQSPRRKPGPRRRCCGRRAGGWYRSTRARRWRWPGSACPGSPIRRAGCPPRIATRA